MKKTIHACLSVPGALRWPRKMLKGLLVNEETGKRMTANEVRDVLLEELAKGHEVLPFGEPCEGFDFKTGCPGHITQEAA